MSSNAHHRALLGRLAADLGWFIQKGEVTATHALYVLLEQDALRTAIVERLGELSGADLDGVDSFYNELTHDDGGRTDLEGHDAEVLRLVVEAKFTARLEPGQIKTYLGYLADAVQRGVGCAFAVLVPASRRVEASGIVQQAKQQLVSDTPECASIPAIVITWDEWLDCWEQAAADVSGPEGSAILGDLVQFRELCRTLQGLYMAPLGDAASGSTAWRSRANDFHRLVDEVTVMLSDRSQRLLPVQRDARLQFTHRYISGGYAVSWCSVGVAGAFADEGGSPLWLRYRKNTGGFQRIRDRLAESKFRIGVRHDDGHVWVPLHVPEDVSGPAISEDLVRQVRDIHAAVATPDLMSPGPPE